RLLQKQELTRNLGWSELPVKKPANLACFRQFRKSPKHARQQPMTVNTGMPIVAAVENGMFNLGGARQILRPMHHVPRHVRPRPRDVPECETRKFRGDLSG